MVNRTSRSQSDRKQRTGTSPFAVGDPIVLQIGPGSASCSLVYWCDSGEAHEGISLPASAWDAGRLTELSACCSPSRDRAWSPAASRDSGGRNRPEPSIRPSSRAWPRSGSRISARSQLPGMRIRPPRPTSRVAPTARLPIGSAVTASVWQSEQAPPPSGPEGPAGAGRPLADLLSATFGSASILAAVAVKLSAGRWLPCIPQDHQRKQLPFQVRPSTCTPQGVATPFAGRPAPPAPLEDDPLRPRSARVRHHGVPVAVKASKARRRLPQALIPQPGQV